MFATTASRPWTSTETSDRCSSSARTAAAPSTPRPPRRALVDELMTTSRDQASPAGVGRRAVVAVDHFLGPLITASGSHVRRVQQGFSKGRDAFGTLARQLPATTASGTFADVAVARGQGGVSELGKSWRDPSRFQSSRQDPRGGCVRSSGTADAAASDRRRGKGAVLSIYGYARRESPRRRRQPRPANRFEAPRKSPCIIHRRDRRRRPPPRAAGGGHDERTDAQRCWARWTGGEEGREGVSWSTRPNVPTARPR